MGNPWALIHFNGWFSWILLLLLGEESLSNFSREVWSELRQRIVELPEILKDVCHEWVFDKDPDDPLFHTLEGKHIRNTNFTRRVFIPALAKAGIKKIRIHDLRHTAASIAISAGATPNMVKEMLGHSDVQMTMRIYAHIFEADREKVAASVNRAVKEVHQMRMDVVDGVLKPVQLITKNGSEQGFSFGLQTWNHGRTSDYESGALTNWATASSTLVY